MATPDENGWYPIETAKKDGTEVDLWAVNEHGQGRRICESSWETQMRWDGSEFDGWTGMYPTMATGPYTPTHWRPAPKPPVGA